MSRFFFDLHFDRCVVLDPGGMMFEHASAAMAAAEELAHHLLTTRAELRSGHSWIRVRDQRRREVYRCRIGPEATERRGSSVDGGRFRDVPHICNSSE